MCASLYKRAGSPFFWLKPKNGKARSTKLRHAVVGEARQAHDLKERESAKERQAFTEPERWDRWVTKYIQERYEDSPKSLRRYGQRWKAIRSFLGRHGVLYPKQLTFEVASRYLEWRRAGDRDYGVYAVARNTAIYEVKFLGLLMRRAINFGYATSNPCAAMGLKKTKPQPKPEFTDAELNLVWREIQTEAEWMRVAFEISLYTGCRLNETAVPLDCVDLKRKFIHFPDTKGDRPFTVPMRDELVPLFRRLLAEGRPVACVHHSHPSLEFRRFFDRIKLDKHTFHCCRVSFISRGARAGVPISEMLRLVNHASHEIHRVYQRFQPEDLRRALDKLELPALAKYDGSESLDARPTTPPAQLSAARQSSASQAPSPS